MKFFCEYCGNRIDAEKDQKCPHCGASYKKNETFIKMEEERKQVEQETTEYKKKIVTHVLGAITFSRFFMIIPIIIFVVIFLVIITSAVSIGKKANMNQDNNIKIEEIFESVIGEETKEEKILVNFNEFAETEKYKVKVESYETKEDVFHHAEEGYELVKFHLIVENKTQSEISREDVNCIVDGVAQTNDLYAGHSDLPFHISSELAVKGTATFIVPKNATSYDIRYGDFVTIHIDK